jgi:hypothetical protein
MLAAVCVAYAVTVLSSDVSFSRIVLFMTALRNQNINVKEVLFLF